MGTDVLDPKWDISGWQKRWFGSGGLELFFIELVWIIEARQTSFMAWAVLVISNTFRVWTLNFRKKHFKDVAQKRKRKEETPKQSTFIRKLRYFMIWGFHFHILVLGSDSHTGGFGRGCRLKKRGGRWSSVWVYVQLLWRCCFCCCCCCRWVQHFSLWNNIHSISLSKLRRCLCVGAGGRSDSARGGKEGRRLMPVCGKLHLVDVSCREVRGGGAAGPDLRGQCDEPAGTGERWFSFLSWTKVLVLTPSMTEPRAIMKHLMRFRQRSWRWCSDGVLW